MMDENDILLILQLKETFSSQLSWYRDLRDLVRKILSRLVLSRGDVSGVISGLEKKKKLLETIEAERNRTADIVMQWQQRKSNLKSDQSVEDLNVILDQMGTVIREFLDEEEQLKNYLQSIIRKESLVT
jgi:hypothetical protein